MTKMVPSAQPASAVAQKASTRMPPTTAIDFEPPSARMMMPSTVMSTVGISAVSVKMSRAR